MRPLIVRLPNWVGDVIMSLPTLWHLHRHGYALHLIGKHWATTLLSGCPWPVHPLPSQRRERVRLLRRLGQAAQQEDTDFGKRLNTLLLTNSFSSALESWLAGLNTVGYRQDHRGWLLTHPVTPPSPPVHESQRFLLAAQAIAPGTPTPAGHDACPDTPSVSPLPLTETARQAAAGLLQQHGLLQNGTDADARPLPYACLVPFATGTLKNGTRKAWPDFPTLARQLTCEIPVLLVPGPGAETALARHDYPEALILDNVALDVYAALLARSTVVVANDTGPGHLAAAVGAQLISILGPTDASRYRALGTNVTLIQNSPWPSLDTVLQQTRQAISAERTA